MRRVRRLTSLLYGNSLSMNYSKFDMNLNNQLLQTIQILKPLYKSIIIDQQTESIILYSYNMAESMQQIEQRMSDLQNLINQKNEIIYHLGNRVKNQQKQINMLVSDAQEKNMHQIRKCYAKNYDKYLKYGKYLLIRLDQTEHNGIYLPKYAQISYNKDSNIKKAKTQPISESNEEIVQNRVQNYNYCQNFQSISPREQKNWQKIKQEIQLTFKGQFKTLLSEFLQLKDKLKINANTISQQERDNNIKIGRNQQNGLANGVLGKTYKAQESHKLHIVQESQTKPIVQTSQFQANCEKLIESYKRKHQLKRLPSLSPLKKKSHSKTIIIRRR